MKKRFAKFLSSPTKILDDPTNQRALIIGVFIFLFLCLIFLLFRRVSRAGPEEGDVNGTPTSSSPFGILFATSTRDPAPGSAFYTPEVAPTKWWDKRTATPAADSSEIVDTDCHTSLSPGIFAYVSLSPPLPNRVRSGAGKQFDYIGQIYPGGGMKLVEGPRCVNGQAWWMVESNRHGLKGWMMEAEKKSDKWILPCPDQKVACDKSPVSQATSTPTKKAPRNDKDDNDEGNNESGCRSDKFFIGAPAMVAKDTLLVIRDKPLTGEVIGYAGALESVNIIEGPACAGGAIWWKVKVVGLTGWTVEDNLSKK